MIVPAAFRVQFGLLCLNHLLPSLVQAAKPTPPKLCNTLTNVTRGTIITTKPSGNNMWCGLNTRHYLAVADNKLFYLYCPLEYRNHAVGSIFYPNLTSESYRTFYPTEMCDVKTGTFNTKDNSNILADMLEGRLVPYDANGCNPKHYIEYLTYGNIPRTSNLRVSPTCPVFQTFTAWTRIDNNFRLKDQQSYYAWPSTPRAGYLTPISQTRNQVPNNPLKKSSSGNSRKGLGGWVGRVLSRNWGSPKRLGGVDKRGGGGGGHGGGGGGHGSSGGGHGGEGSVGGGGEGSTGTGAGATGYRPYVGGRGGGRTSAGNRPQPLLGFKIPSGNWARWGYNGYGGGGQAIGYRP
ncbi:unnamed protein product [Bemisia tabaci]|uniref:Uncharacterized protein n=1 Tax=Bemisia tabaci TaxID=7038 RepID=A0A9P0F0M4_BEMTA|nr:unnamed protein product [Bemisia tabaci]